MQTNQVNAALITPGVIVETCFHFPLNITRPLLSPQATQYLQETLLPPTLVITQFLNILFFPLVHYFVHIESQGETNKVLSHVFFLLIKTIKYSENRSPELWPAINSLQAAPSWASEVYFRCCHMGLMQGKSTPC